MKMLKPEFLPCGGNIFKHNVGIEFVDDVTKCGNKIATNEFTVRIWKLPLLFCRPAGEPMQFDTLRPSLRYSDNVRELAI